MKYTTYILFRSNAKKKTLVNLNLLFFKKKKPTITYMIISDNDSSQCRFGELFKQ